MARKAQYNVEDVLSDAIQIFLEHGYNGAVMDEIIARTDFNRRGFYMEFGSKQSFLYKVLDHYQSTQLNPIFSHLEANHGLPSIYQFFKEYIEIVKGRGCLLVNCITELGFDDEKIREIGRHHLDRLEIGFIGCLEKAVEQGQVKNTINIEASALQLCNYIQGFAVTAILAGHTDELDLAVNSLLDPLAA
ncbi:TetR/AcrR family transcriptional regulator [Paraneptunicella aestuarii]|uniref:TetR/AcrR family transcriptional regulator n=1 Tax=Paraneptunicella aestuarii TaxID=2831148 RepID=UPI001E619643|nr:TetR/AcrR family transcriptional regulator [Paraneptunicella aestuarii]UAA38840.1 TetR/AcrR family transcriptional regulator [Paraneptunicella aestuarii]